MGMTIRLAMEKLIDMPVALLLVTVLVFVVVMAALAAVSYVVACARSKGTEMTGLMQVSVSLNGWCDDKRCKDLQPLELGSFGFSLKDPAYVEEKDRLDRKLVWHEKMYRRRYAVSLFLKRFLAAYKSAGLEEDPSARLLENLLENERFCRDLGACCYYNGKRGLDVKNNAYNTGKDSNKEKISVYHEIDGAAFSAETGCKAETICITLEYRK